MKLIRIDECVPVRWKNGLGTTREIWKQLDDAGEILIRISIAEMEGTQAFSVFPRMDRVILQLDGPQAVLTIDGAVHPLMPEKPFAFAGEQNVSCALAGPGKAQDLNLMCRRDAFVPHMRVVRLEPEQEITLGDEDQFTAAVALGPCSLHAASDVDLQAYDTVLVDTLGVMHCKSSGVFAVLTADAR
jgi:uncharacterized protein